jgi:hypothetical protein
MSRAGDGGLIVVDNNRMVAFVSQLSNVPPGKSGPTIISEWVDYPFSMRAVDCGRGLSACFSASPLTSRMACEGMLKHFLLR